MAIANSDGSIILPVTVDTDGLDDGINAIKRRAKSLDNAFNNVERTITNALNVGDTKTANLANNFKKATEEVIKQSAKVDELRAKLAELEKGKLSGEKFKGLQAEINKTEKEIISLQNEVLKLDKEINSNTSNEAITDLRKKRQELLTQISEYSAKSNEMQAQLQNSLDVAPQIAQTSAELANAENKLDNLSTKAEIAGQKLQEATSNELKEKVSSIGDGFSKMGTKLLGMAKRVFVFAVITSALRSVRTAISDVLMSNTQFTNSLNQLKSSLWTAFAPIYNTVVPALITLVNWLNTAVTAITKFFATVTGKSYSAMVANGQALQKQAENYKKVGKSSGAAAKGMKQATKEAEKQLAAFDDLQILQDNSKDTGADVGGSGGGGIADTSTSADIGNFVPDVEPWKTAITGLIEVLAGVGLVALGIILCSMGNIGWGVGCIIFGLGAMGVGIATLSEAFDASGAKEMLLIITGITGVILLSLGIILLYLGNIPWGIGALAGGLALLGYTAYQMATKLNTEEMLSTLSIIMSFVSGALVAIGILLIWLGSPAWGIGFIIAGAVSLAVSIAALSKLETTEIQTLLQTIVAMASGALLALGIIMIALAGPSPLAIGLIAAGAVGLATVVALDYTATKNKVSTFLQEHQGLIVGIALALLVLGIILCCAGVSLPLGIALIATGAAGLVTIVALNWETIKTKVQDVINKIFDWLKTAAKLVLGVMLVASGIGFPLGLALILSGVGDIIEEVEIMWTKYGDKIEEVFGNIKNWLKTWGLLVLGVILCVSGVGLPLGLALIKEGGANLTEAQDPMWDTFKNKVKEVWESIKLYWEEHIAKYFTAEWWEELATTAIKSFANNIIDGLNKLIRKINSLSFDMPDVLGGAHIGFSIPEIPRLAQGAVIPANREFLAVLGDQKHGTNIEAPAELIKQMAKEAYREMGLANNQQQQIIKEEHYNLSETELMTIMYKLVKGGERLNGTSLVRQGGI